MARTPRSPEALAAQVEHLASAYKESLGMLREVLEKVGDVRERMATREQVAELEKTVQSHAPEVAKVAKLEQQVTDLRKELEARVRPLEDERTRARAVLAFVATATGAGGIGLGAALMRFFGGHQ